jgi:uncharacterized protein (DUF1697 family)
MARLVALLRGINVGGHKKVPMGRLREVLAGAGFEDVRTYVQSGNVALTAPPRRSPEQVGRAIEAAIEEAFGFDVAVVMRTRDEIAALVADDPLGDVATNPAYRVVVFLAAPLDRSRLADVDPDEFAPEAFVLRDREIVMWAPNGQRDSRLVKTLSEQRTGVTGTARNWRTVEKLLVLADEAAPRT